MYVLHIVKGGDYNLGLKNRKARLLESVRYTKTQDVIKIAYYTW